MPFDGPLPLQRPEPQIRPSLANLSTTLRHPEQWPAGFVWDYQFGHSCALGLAVRLWGEPIGTLIGSCAQIFFRAPTMLTIVEKRPWWAVWRPVTYRRPCMREVQPHHIADLIDAHLAKNAS